MYTRAEIERDRQALKALVGNAQAELRAILARVPSADHVATMSDSAVVDLYEIIRGEWWKIADRYGTMGAVLGQAQASMMMVDGGYKSPTLGIPVGIPDADSAASALITAMGQDDWQAALTTSLDGTVKTANTWSICDTLNNNGADLIWYPEGDKPCRYCLQRASHGAYSNFRSEAQARGFAKRPHDWCECRPLVVPADGTFPDDYHPTEYSRQVEQMDREKFDRTMDRIHSEQGTPGPKTRENVRRDMSAKAWADRQRITRERDAAKNRLERATAKGDTTAANAAQAVLERTAAERAALNGTN